MGAMRPILACAGLSALVVLLALNMPLPAQAMDVTAAVKRGPLAYTVYEYGLVLGTSLLGGIVAWSTKVKRGEISATSFTALIGELTTAAFAGLIAFFVCEWLGLHPLLIAAITGISGHMGTRAIVMAEAWLERRVERETER